MAGYNDTRNLIIEALMGRQAGTEIQPEKHQAYALNMLDYVRSVELVSSSTLVGLAEESTVPVQPDQGKVCYIAGVGQDRTVTFSNFIDNEGNPISITTGEMEGVFVILLWNMEHWVAYTFNTNIISSAESANFYYGYNIRKTYASVAAMNADSVNPIGTDGRLIKIGELVTVVNSTTPAENGYYSYEGSENGWLLQNGFSFEIVQTTGTDINKAMSQKAVTDEIAQLAGNVTVKLENLVVNGDFRDGNNLWETNSANLTGSGKFVATAKDGRIQRSGGNRISYKAGDKIYMAANFKADTPLAWFNSNLGTNTGYFHSGSGLFERQSVIYTAPVDSTGQPSFIRIGDGRNSGWTEIEVAYMYALNLTEIFGVGNEPTIEEFESLLNLIGTEYFEGTYNIPSQLVMQWILGLIESDYSMLLALDYSLNGTPVYENYTIKSCNIKWVNGMTGILTFSDFDEVENAFTSFTATCPDLGMIVRQPKVIFDGNGQITNYPSLIVETI